MIFETERLILRPWSDSDAEDLYEVAKDPDVGLSTGWPPHKSVEDSLFVIRNILSVDETYAIVIKDKNKVIGSISLMKNEGRIPQMTENDVELGFWIGKPYWGNGYVPEASKVLISHAFEDLKSDNVWCGFFDGNQKSKRCQEKLGFIYHHTDKNVYWKLLDKHFDLNINVLPKNAWENCK